MNLKINMSHNGTQVGVGGWGMTKHFVISIISNSRKCKLICFIEKQING